MAVQLVVHEGRLDQPLAVVEDAIDLDGGDVLSEGGELALLNGADLALGVEHVDVDAVDAEEAVGHGRAGVARCGHEHVDLLAAAFHAYEVLQQSGHEPCADVLEGERRSVEELERVDVVGDGYDGAVEAERVVDDVLQGVEVDVVAEEGACHVVGDVAERHLVNVVEEGLRQVLDFLRHVESAVLCQTFDHRLAEVGDGGFPVGAIVLHKCLAL